MSLRPLIATAATATFWVVLAWRAPTSTYHFAPLIAAAVGPWFAKVSGGRVPVAQAALVVVPCAGVTLVALAVLALADRMQGPTFVSDSGAWIEASIFTAIGAAIGLVVLTRSPTGRLQRRSRT